MDEVTNDNLPKYVMFGGGNVKNLGTEMRLAGNFYYRDAGNWRIEFKVVDGKLFSVCKDADYLDNVELTPITKEQWAKGNEGYV